MAQVQAEPPTMYKLEVQKTIIPCSKSLINHSSLIMDLLEFSIDDDRSAFYHFFSLSRNDFLAILDHSKGRVATF